MVQIPDELKYTGDHEWAMEEGELLVIGITDYAQDALGEIVYIELPSEGDEITKGDPFGAVESTKAVSDLYAPVSGDVVEVNEVLLDAFAHDHLADGASAAHHDRPVGNAHDMIHVVADNDDGQATLGKSANHCANLIGLANA